MTGIATRFSHLKNALESGYAIRAPEHRQRYRLFESQLAWFHLVHTDAT